MSDTFDFREPMLEMFIFETGQLLDQLEEILIRAEKDNKISKDDVNEIFRIMHTIKGSAAMMMYTGISSLAHALEDLFQFIRESPKALDSREVCDFALKAADYIRTQVTSISQGIEPDEEQTQLANEIRDYLVKVKGSKGKKTEIKETEKIESNQKYYISAVKKEKSEFENKYVIKVFFDDGCMMENVRAYAIVHNVEEYCSELYHRPPKIFDDESASENIAQNGFDLYITTEMEERTLLKILDEAILVKSYTLSKVDDYSLEILDVLTYIADNQVGRQVEARSEEEEKQEAEEGKGAQKAAIQNIISVNVNKLDKLMDLVGEIVITESMVSGNKDLAGLHLDSFNKAARQLRKLTDELQDIVMSIRMVPVATTFHKMNRIVRDMSKALKKEVELKIVGEETEVDKNIIDNLSDPLMHLIRNAMDHGFEREDERKNTDKPPVATLRLEAQNTGGDVMITVSDDGKGLDREIILKKAREKGLVTKADNELTDKEVFMMILLPGFSTKDKITEYSGRGVGMDVVKKNIEKLGGNVAIESVLGKGTNIIIRIPLTLAIVDGMEVSVGESIYTIPTISIRESFKAASKDIVTDTDGNEMIMIRGNCYPIVRLHRIFGVIPKVTDLVEGIMVMVEEHDKQVVLFADRLIGEQQVVVKPLPTYFSDYGVKQSGIGGCTILGDGNISLILDVLETVDRVLKS